MIKIGRKTISYNSPAFVIAEAGVNHNGKLSLAKKLVLAAKRAGADAVKFQTYETGDLVVKSALAAHYDLLKRLELSAGQLKRLAILCAAQGMIFLSTPHTLESIGQLKNIVPAFKVASGDLTNHYFLKKLAKTGKPIILSTGMGDLSEVAEAVKVIEKEGNKKITLLHCTSNYPCPPTEVNLRAMMTMMKQFKYPVGYSDHTLGAQTAVMAATLGACIIEKHLTLSKKLTGPDHMASMEPREFSELVKAVRAAPVILGRAEKKPAATELLAALAARKSVVAARTIKRGEKFTAKNLGLKRPGTGVPAKFYEKIIGRASRRNILADTLISKEDYD